MITALSGLTFEAPAQFKAQFITQTTSTLTIDRSKGEYAKITLSGNVATINITGWPTSDILGRVQIEIESTGTYSFNGWPAGTKWIAGFAPEPDFIEGEILMIVLTSSDGGATILGSIVGQCYS